MNCSLTSSHKTHTHGLFQLWSPIQDVSRAACKATNFHPILTKITNFIKKNPKCEILQNLIIGSHTVPCGWMDGQRWQTTVTLQFALQTCLKPNSFTFNILPSLSTCEHYFQNQKASSAGILKKIQVQCRRSQPRLIIHWNLTLMESQGTKIIFLCRQFPFNTVTWSMDHQDSRFSEL